MGKSKHKGKITGNNIKQLLKKKNMTQTRLAELVCKSKENNESYISRIVNNKYPQLSLGIALKIASVLNTPIEEVFIFDNEESQTKQDSVDVIVNKDNEYINKNDLVDFLTMLNSDVKYFTAKDKLSFVINKIKKL